jgi:hypothetical protein
MSTRGEEYMDAPRTRLRAIAEWLVAAAILIVFAGIGTTALRDFRTVTAATPVSAREFASSRPTASIPPRSISVPLLLLGDGVEVRIGDSARDVMERLSAAAESGPPAVERGPYGERQTRWLTYRDTTFALVVEPFARDTEPRVTAIFLR